MSEFHKLTRMEAVQHLMKIIGEEKRTADEISALQMATFRLVQRYCQHRRHNANNRAANEANAAEGGAA